LEESCVVICIFKQNTPTPKHPIGESQLEVIMANLMIVGLLVISPFVLKALFTTVFAAIVMPLAVVVTLFVFWKMI
jgi:hypothetical protein